MAGVKGRVRPHNRFFYWAYWRGVEPADDRSRMWFMEPDCAYTFPNEDGLWLVLVGPHRDRLPEFRHDLEGAYLDAALDSYRKVHRRRLGLHNFVISDIATGRPANPVERAMYRGRARSSAAGGWRPCPPRARR
jgi:hypothetical protein